MKNTENNPDIITMTDLRNAGCCPPGIRGWFKDHGLDYRQLVTVGIPTELFLEKGDAHAVRIVKRKQEIINGKVE